MSKLDLEPIPVTITPENCLDEIESRRLSDNNTEKTNKRELLPGNHFTRKVTQASKFIRACDIDISLRDWKKDEVFAHIDFTEASCGADKFQFENPDYKTQFKYLARTYYRMTHGKIKSYIIAFDRIEHFGKEYLGNNVVYDVIEGRKYYMNRASLDKWLRAYCPVMKSGDYRK